MDSNLNRWRSPRSPGFLSPWRNTQNQFGGEQRFYSPRNSPRQNFSPYNFNRNSSPSSLGNSPQSTYQQRYSPYHNNRPRHQYRHSSPRFFQNQSSFASPESSERSMQSPRRWMPSPKWSRDEIENWIIPSMWEDPWAHLRPTKTSTMMKDKEEEENPPDKPNIDDVSVSSSESEKVNDLIENV